MSDKRLTREQKKAPSLPKAINQDFRKDINGTFQFSDDLGSLVRRGKLDVSYNSISRSCRGVLLHDMHEGSSL